MCVTSDLSTPEPKLCTLTPNGHLELTLVGGSVGSRGSFPQERLTFALDSRKSSVMSLGKSSLERRSLSLVTHTHTQTHTHIQYCAVSTFSWVR